MGNDSDECNDLEEAVTEVPFESKLKQGRERFLSEIAAEVLRVEERSADDFIRHFPPDVIMEGLKDQPKLRAKILVATVGLKPKMALKKSHASAGEDLQLTLDEKETDANEILMTFDPDDRVRYLSDEKLWAFTIESAFWNRGKDEDIFERARGLVTYILERAIAHKLLTLRDIVFPVAMKQVKSDLTTDELWDIIRTALEAKEKFDYYHFLEAVPLNKLTQHVPLWTFWEQIIARPIAEKYGFVPCPEPEPEAESEDESAEGPGSWEEVQEELLKDEDDEGKAHEASAAGESGAESDTSPVADTSERALIGKGPVSKSSRPDLTAVFDSSEAKSAPESVQSISDAVTQAAIEEDGADVEIEEGRMSDIPDELLDAVEEENGAATTVMESPFDSDTPHIPETEFEEARSRSGLGDRVSTPGSIASSDDLVKQALIQHLREDGFKLVGTDDAKLKDVIIQTLVEIKPGTYGRQVMELREGPTSGLAKVLIRQLKASKPELAKKVQDDLSTVKSGSTAAQHPDPKTRQKTKSSPRTAKSPQRKP